MILKNGFRLAIAAGVVSAGGILIGCGSTGGGGSDGSGNDPYVPPTTLGSISVRVNDKDLGVSETSGFSVVVKDSGGNGIPLTRITCDSEEGVALVEPTKGSEITDASGAISGTVGCEKPGSYLFGCRLPVGGNKRQFVTITCRPPIPSGFNGFPGAGGGGLGGGGGSSSTPGVSITAVTVSELEKDVLTVDTLAGVCGSGTEITAEPYSDTLIKFRVSNETDQRITFNSYSYSIDGVFESSDISVTGTLVAEPGAEGIDIQAFFADAAEGQKTFIGSSTAIGAIGPTSVSVTLRGTNGLGQVVRTSAAFSVSFNNYNNCSN
ncbi:MAG: hypothetical protein EBZ48_08960 [Proteobacteria bacterium]|nr:hypothetical protein [Pseudomonadota bacterium]